jgi:gas vesicle protein
MKLILGFLLGAIVGGAMALLFAPSSGDQLRQNLKSQADTQYARMQEEWQKGKNEMQSRIDKVSSEIKAKSSGLDIAEPSAE